ncbi:unnamed protein product [Peniophora sp. CBMAI 1063]|nr:unnamed protein product [Peniophora sp. CBMAI 1063]
MSYPELRRRTRQVVLALLERRTARDPFPAHKIPTREQVLHYETLGEAGPTIAEWMVDPLSTFSAIWNQRAGDLLLELLLAQGIITPAEGPDIRAYVASYHNNSLRRHYRSLNLSNSTSIAGRATNMKRRRNVLSILSRSHLEDTFQILHAVDLEPGIYADDEDDPRSINAAN